MLGSGVASSREAHSFLAGQTLATDVLPRSLAAADLDGDGKLDLVVACQGSSTVNVFRGNGGATFSGLTRYTVFHFALSGRPERATTSSPARCASR